jgi:hypothetical protein
MRMLAVWLPESAKQALAQRARERGLPLSEFCRHVLMMELNQEAGGAANPASRPSDVPHQEDRRID